MEYEKVSNGDILEIGGRRLKVLLGPGHSAAQIMLRSEEENFLMSVDQVLGNAFSLLIPPVDDPMRDVYTEFMASLDELERITDPETLVIAGHYTPFNRALGRIDATRDYHRGREEMVLNACAERPRTIEELAVIVYIKKMTDRQLQHAVFDVLAYVNRLVATHRLTWLPQKGATRLIALA